MLQADFYKTFFTKISNAAKDSDDEPELNTNSREKLLVYVWRLKLNLDASVCIVCTSKIQKFKFKEKGFPKNFKFRR